MLRPYTQDDLPHLVAIEQLTQLSPWSLEIFDRCWRAGYAGWVITKLHDILGFVLCSLHAGECHILNLCVHPNFQRQGYAQQLLQHVLIQAKKQDAKMIFLEVRRSNTPAINLYLKLGFVQIGDRKNYYPASPGREDALVFAMDISTE